MVYKRRSSYYEVLRLSKKDKGGSTENNAREKLYFYLFTPQKGIFILQINNLSPPTRK